LEVRAERGGAAFWSMHDALLDSERSPDDAALDDAALERLASRFGAREGAVKMAIAKHSHTRAIEDDLSLADDLGADGTPQFFINGRRLVGAQSKEEFEAVIDEEMARARALLAAGRSPVALYDALLRDGARPPEPEKKAIGGAAIARTGSRGPTRGDAAAKVTIHEWSDFQCPFCARAEATIERVLATYRDVKLVWHDLPLPMRPFALMAGQAAREALRQKRAGAFWAIHDEILRHQADLGREALDGYARTLGLDMGRWKSAIDGAVRAADLEADRQAAAELGISGTPAFVVVPSGKESGYFIGGAQGYIKFRKVIERALAEAK
ncbi:MAG: DsbA family protein, partial [Myxococcota bacterium]|nr:DsbA family protein [Myxococcota bacterium]